MTNTPIVFSNNPWYPLVLDMDKLIPRCHISSCYNKIECFLLIPDYTQRVCVCVCVCVNTLRAYLQSYLYQLPNKNIQNFNIRMWKTPSCRTLHYPLYKGPATLAPHPDPCRPHPPFFTPYQTHPNPYFPESPLFSS